MGAPVFEPRRVPFDASGLVPRSVDGFELWPLELSSGAQVEVAVLSMGNPHAVQRVADVDAAPVATHGPLIETPSALSAQASTPASCRCVDARRRSALRVYERGAGETLACGTGACAAVVAGIRLGWLDARGRRRDARRRADDRVGRAATRSRCCMTGPAETVFEGEIEL